MNNTTLFFEDLNAVRQIDLTDGLFRSIHTTSGEYVDVIHPEMAMVGRSAFVVALRPVRGVADAFAWYSLIHIVKVVSLRSAKRRKRRA